MHRTANHSNNTAHHWTYTHQHMLMLWCQIQKLKH